MANTNGTGNLEVGSDLVITKVTKRRHAGGTWVSGRIAGHRFYALVFPGHADHSEWEIADSRISKLWVQRLADGQVVFNWDRGMAIAAKDEVAQASVDFLAAGLAEHIFAE